MVARMPVDHIELLRWMEERERREGRGVGGAELLSGASHLARNELEPWEAVTRAVELLDGIGCLLWRQGTDDVPRVADGLISRETLQLVEEIRISAAGQAICQHASGAGTTQITIIRDSTIGQLAMGDNTIGDIRVLITAAREQLEGLEAPEAVKEEARTMLERLQGVAGTVGTSAAASLVSSALQSAIGLK
jgi:hypothetical protein